MNDHLPGVIQSFEFRGPRQLPRARKAWTGAPAVTKQQLLQRWGGRNSVYVLRKERNRLQSRLNTSSIRNSFVL